MKHARLAPAALGKVLLFFWMAFLAAPQRVFAAPLTPEQVPETLRPWIDWALVGHEQERCPFLSSGSQEKLCAWASKLQLTIDEKQGQFSQQWEVFKDQWVPLPGDEKRWPQQVKAGAQPMAAVLHDGVPSVFLKKGVYLLSGSYQWDKTPESFQIPDATGVLALTLKGKPIDFPQLKDGLLWLETDAVAQSGQETLELRVNRKVDDDIPLILTTRIDMNVSGKAREVLLGKALPDDFVLMEINSPIPARVDPDGRLKVQASAGNFTIEIRARHQGPVTDLTLPSEPALSPEEVWVFQAQNNLRLVNVEGLVSIDPQQTTLPDDWKSLPAYRIHPGETMKLVQRRRGDSDPAPDQLSLYRRLWLDFNGGAYTFQDTVSGTMNRNSRLEMNAPVQLGRVSIGGEDQLITQLPGDKKAGVEVRQAQLDVSADSRLVGSVHHIPAIGWNHDFQKVRGELNLPPGWSLLAVTGADEVPDTWISHWNLLNIFMVLILFLIFLKLWGKVWGLVALLGLVLTYNEPGAPQWVWLALLAGCAVLRLLKPGKLRFAVKLYTGVALIVWIVISIPFMVGQARQGMYPVLQHPYQHLDAFGGDGDADAGRGGYTMQNVNEETNPPAPRAQAQQQIDALQVGTEKEQNFRRDVVAGEQLYDGKSTGKMRGFYSDDKHVVRKESTKTELYNKKMEENLVQQRPGTKVQTGPGLPRWQWNRYDLQWNGPVEKSQELRIWMLSPLFNLILSFVRVALLALLILCVLGMPGSFWPSFLRGRREIWLALFAFLMLGGTALPARADIPSKEILDELRERLLQNPECFPDCAALSRMQLTVAGNQVTARMEISTEGLTAVPLPGSFEEWTPQSVSVDGQPFSALHRSDEGQLWLQLAPGVHQVVVSGPLPERASVQIALPLKPHYLEAQVSDWHLEGLQENGLTADTLQLTRAQSLNSSAAVAQSTTLPPFFKVERHLVLGLTWEVQTRVVRLTPVGTAFVADVSLLPGESVTDAEVQVKDNKVSVSMGPNATDFEWHSVLAESPEILLKATDSNAMTEVWLLDLNPIWHVQTEGIPPVHPNRNAGRWPIEWRPWPGEQVQLKLSRPAGIPGQTVTIDSSVLAITPGLRFTESKLSLSLRSSLGGQQNILLPEGSVLQSVQINGMAQPIRQEGMTVSLPIVPGAQRVEMVWQQPLALKTLFRSPEVKLGIPSVNTEIQVTLPQNRWVLFTGGLRVGPAVLFWSMLVVLLLVSVALGRSGKTPLKTYHWILLGLGLTQVPVWASVIVAGWFLVLGWRQRRPLSEPVTFDLLQILLVGWTLAALTVIVLSIHQGLLGMPDMQISGNGSSYTFLRWFQDRSLETLPRTWVISVPLFCYRLAMLAWALWLALALLRWLRWAWTSVTTGGGWKALRVRKPVTPPSPQ